MSFHKKQVFAARDELLRGLGVPPPAKFHPDRFQLDAIESLKGGNDTLVIAPTGAGKTFIAIEAIRAVMERGKRAVYTAPLKALSNAKYADMKKLFEPEFRVGLLTGDRKIEGDADIVIATTEIYRNELYGYSDNYALVVLDELHYLADPQRGPVWEESIVLSAKSSTLLMLSASISNPDEVAAWIGEVRGKPVTIIAVEERPVPLRYGFLHPELGVIPLSDERGELFPEVARWTATDSRGHRPRMRGMRPRRRSG
jgi:superfamily II RNA helicase